VYRYALFHALLVPVILLKGDPSSPRSISYIQDIERAKSAVENLSVEGDTLSQSFVTVLDRLFTVARQPHRQDTPQRSSRDDLPFPKIDGFQNPINNIFGNEELRLLENSVPKKSTGLDFSEWLRS
jgi:hypothetical protein